MTWWRASKPEHDSKHGKPKVPRKIAAEAAFWVSRLHGPDRSRQMELDCLAWQAQSDVHRYAFERCTDVWMAIPGIRVSDALSAAAAESERVQRQRLRVLLVVGGTVLAGGGAWLAQRWRDRDTYATAVGEQRIVTLSDGTRMSLNTKTRVRVRIEPGKRRLTVDEGEALFEVAKDPSRPFIVRVGDTEVVALGTVFSVKETSGSLRQPVPGVAVTLLEGSVSVRTGVDAVPAAPTLLRPGDRMRITDVPAAPVRAQIDRPRLDQVLAWRTGDVVFENTALEDAVVEVNRYSHQEVVLELPALGRLSVSGQFRTGDNQAFARAVAALHHLTLVEQDGRLVLRPPN